MKTQQATFYKVKSLSIKTHEDQFYLKVGKNSNKIKICTQFEKKRYYEGTEIKDRIIYLIYCNKHWRSPRKRDRGDALKFTNEQKTDLQELSKLQRI